jgi:hypothetical protein
MPSQQISFLIKVLGEEQGAEVSAEMEVVLQPRELQAKAVTALGRTWAPFASNNTVVSSPSSVFVLTMLGHKFLSQ